MRDEESAAMHSSYENVDYEVASILLDVANGHDYKLSDGSSSFPSSKSNTAESHDAGDSLEIKRTSGDTDLKKLNKQTTSARGGMNQQHPGGVINEKRKLTVIPPKQPQSTPNAGFPFCIMYFLSAVRVALTTPGAEDLTLALSKPLEAEDGNKRPGHGLFKGISKRNAEGNSCEKDTTSSIRSECNQRELPSLTFNQIMQRVRSNPGDARVLEMKVRLQDLLRGVLRIFSSTTPPPGITLWKPLVVYDKSSKLWSWFGPVASHWPRADVIPTSPEAWGMRGGILNRLVDCFGEWLKAKLDVLQRFASLPPPPLLLMPQILPRERFREPRNLKNSVRTIGPSCEEVRAYFHTEEALRYSIPEQAFTYTTRDGRKSTVVPLKRCNGKPSKKAREHFILKPNRPPSFSVLCLVRDAAARLPHCLGTRSDICTLARDSQYVKEDAADDEIKQVVSGALDRLHYECDPCVIFDRDQSLWSYLHGNKEEEDFDENCTVSARHRENKSKKLRAGNDGMLESSKS